MGTILYECSYQAGRHTFIPIIVLLGFLYVLFFGKEVISTKLGNAFRVILCVFAILVSGLASWATLQSDALQRQQVVAAYENGDYQIVEGYVENFHPMPYEGHDTEHFEINGVYFEYSDYTNMQGYHNTASHGGVITGDGQHLRIGYVTLGEDDTRFQVGNTTVTVGGRYPENIIVYIEELP